MCRLILLQEVEIVEGRTERVALPPSRGKEEDAHLFVVALCERVCESEPVVVG